MFDIINFFIGSFLCSGFIVKNGVNKIFVMIVICYVDVMS